VATAASCWSESARDGLASLPVLLRRTIFVLALGLCVASFASCGDDDSTQSEPTASKPDSARYCELSAQLDQAGKEQFQALAKDPNASREDYEAAERDLVEENSDLLEEIQQVAPAEIQDQAATLIASLRVRAGLSDEKVDPGQAKEAEKAVVAFEKQNCPNA
jgi:hypothetical protein